MERRILGKYSDMANSKETRRIFIDSLIEVCLDNGFTGIVMDREYPTFREGTPEDKLNYALLTQASGMMDCPGRLGMDDLNLGAQIYNYRYQKISIICLI